MIDLLTFARTIKLEAFFKEKYIIVYHRDNKSLVGHTGDFMKFGIGIESYEDFIKALMARRISDNVDFVSLTSTEGSAAYMFKEVEYEDFILVLVVPLGSSLQEINNMQKQLEMDEMTGLANRKHALDVLDRQIFQVTQMGGLCSVMMLDIDDFKRINDTYGHEAGDYVIKHVARLLKTVTRASDTIARIGGEEFLVVLPSTGVVGAEVVAKKINNIIANTPCNYRDKVEISQTVSIGVVGIDPLFEGAKENIMRTADDGLYAAKANGKNRYEVCEYILD